MNVKILHINQSFFAKSETFIRNNIFYLNNFHPIYLAEEFVGLENYQLLDKDKYDIKRSSLFSKVYQKIFNSHAGLDSILDKIIKKRGVHIVHAHFGPWGYYAVKARKKTTVPIVTTFYGCDVSQVIRLPGWKARYKILFERGDLFLVEGNYMKTKLIELGCPENKIKIQRIAIPLEKIKFSPRQPKQDGTNVILNFTGRFTEKKGLIYALKAMCEVRKEFTNFEFRIIGEGPLASEIVNYIEQNTMQSYVKILGFLSYDDYIKESQSTDIFIHPSILAQDGDSEGGAPTTILEAQAAGIPIVSTFHADIPNIVIPGKSALLSEERNYTVLAENIKYLLKNQNTWKEMGLVGRKFVEEKHDIRKEIINLEQIYQSLL